MYWSNWPCLVTSPTFEAAQINVYILYVHLTKFGCLVCLIACFYFCENKQLTKIVIVFMFGIVWQ